MTQLGNQLRISNENIESAFQLFIFSVQNKLKSNKSLQSLSISCLYAVCRKEKTPHLLVDFSDISQTRSSKIGVEFLKFLKITRLPLPVIDPSVYIHRFVSEVITLFENLNLIKNGKGVISGEKDKVTNSVRAYLLLENKAATFFLSQVVLPRNICSFWLET